MLEIILNEDNIAKVGMSPYIFIFLRMNQTHFSILTNMIYQKLSVIWLYVLFKRISRIRYCQMQEISVGPIYTTIVRPGVQKTCHTACSHEDCVNILHVGIIHMTQQCQTRIFFVARLLYNILVVMQHIQRMISSHSE